VKVQLTAWKCWVFSKFLFLRPTGPLQIGREVRNQNTLSHENKMELLQAIGEGNRLKIAICKKYGLQKSTLSKVIKNRENIEKITKVANLNRMESA
jgi:hypothetical protein